MLGIVGAARVLTTHLYDLELSLVWIGWNLAWGGAIAPLGNDLLVVSPYGRFSLIRPSGEVVSLKVSLKGNEHFRVPDILLKQHSAGRYELFATHHYFTGECFRFRLSATTLLQQGELVWGAPEWRTIFDAEPCLGGLSIHAGGRMVTDGSEHLLVVTGEHGQKEYAQDPNSHLGKLIRIEIESGRALTLASGFRNPQGLAWDAVGRLWGTDHGPRGGDELNILELGGNYGWPRVSYGRGYKDEVIGYRTAGAGLHDGFTKPAFAWIPSIGICNVVVNDERLFPLWKDDLLIGSLKGHSLFRVRRDGTAVQYVERIEVGIRIRDLAQMPDGRLALLLDGGLVYFLKPRNGG